MSEFYCYEGHSMPSGELYCPKCGSGIGSMDGMGREEAEASENYKEVEDDEEDNYR